MLLRLWLCALLIVLSGCSSIPLSDSMLSADSTTISRQGKFSYVVNEENRVKEAVNGAFTWQDDGQVLTIALFDPFGTQVAQLLVNEQGATLIDQRQGQYTAPTLDDLIQSMFGWSMPVSHMRSWMAGRYSQADIVSETAFDDQQRLIRFKMDPWSVELDRYDQYGPTKITIYQMQGLTRTDIRLVIPMQ